jgi:hypothetical protein
MSWAAEKLLLVSDTSKHLDNPRWVSRHVGMCVCVEGPGIHTFIHECIMRERHCSKIDLAEVKFSCARMCVYVHQVSFSFSGPELVADTQMLFSNSMSSGWPAEWESIDEQQLISSQLSKTESCGLWIFNVDLDPLPSA